MSVFAGSRCRALAWPIQENMNSTCRCDMQADFHTAKMHEADDPEPCWPLDADMFASQAIQATHTVLVMTNRFYVPSSLHQSSWLRHVSCSMHAYAYALKGSSSA